MAAILRSDGLAVTVGRYSVRVEGQPHFTFQEYGGDLGDPVIDADAASVAETTGDCPARVGALARAGVVHRFELYDDTHKLAGYLHHGWPLPAVE